MTPAAVWATAPHQTEDVTVRHTWRDKAAAGLSTPAGVIVHISQMSFVAVFTRSVFLFSAFQGFIPARSESQGLVVQVMHFAPP